MTEPHLMLVDCSGFAYRSFHSAPAHYHPDHGQPTGAVETFLRLMWGLIGQAQADLPTHAAAVFDARGRTFRQDLFPAYKANRPRARTEELDNQFPMMRGAADLLGMRVLEMAGFEADDLIATLAKKALAKGIRVTIVSSDKDFAQCVVDGSVEIVDPMQNKRVLE